MGDVPFDRRREINAVLTAVALGDNRKLPEDTDRLGGERDQLVCQWARSIPDRYTLDELLAAVALHRATSSEWLTPAHLVASVKEARRDRLNRAGPVPYPDDLDQVGEREFRAAWQAAILRGASREQAHAVACGQVGVRAPLEHRPARRPRELAS